MLAMMGVLVWFRPMDMDMVMVRAMGKRGGGGAGDGTEEDGEWAAAVDERETQLDGEWSTATRDGREVAWTANDGMGHQRQRSMNGMQQPGHQPQNKIHGQNGVGRPRCHGFIECSPISNKTHSLILDNNLKSLTP